MHFIFADIVFFGESLPERFHKHVTKVNGYIHYKQFICCKEFSNLSFPCKADYDSRDVSANPGNQ